MSSPARAVIDLEAPACPVDVLAQTGAGTGRLAVARVDGQSAVVACAAASPLHLFTPRPRGAAVWAVLLVVALLAGLASGWWLRGQFGQAGGHVDEGAG